jgi:membrane protein
MRLDTSKLTEKADRAADHVNVPLARHAPAGEIARRLLEQVKQKHLDAYAGHIAYRSLFAIFPSLISLLWLLRLLHATSLVQALLNISGTALPDAAGGVIRQQLSAVPGGHAATSLTVGATLSFVVALWAASAAFRATMEALNVIYDVQETRPTWLRDLLSLLLALATTVLLVGALALVVFGGGIAQKLAQATGQGGLSRAAWLGLTWLVLLGLVLSAFAAVYYFAPDTEERFRWISRGSVAGLVLWLLFTWAFIFYINHLMNYTETYGALAGIAVLMIYVYVVSFILLLGAAINRTLESNAARLPASRRAQ